MGAWWTSKSTSKPPFSLCIVLSHFLLPPPSLVFPTRLTICFLVGSWERACCHRCLQCSRDKTLCSQKRKSFWCSLLVTKNIYTSFRRRRFSLFIQEKSIPWFHLVTLCNNNIDQVFWFQWQVAEWLCTIFDFLERKFDVLIQFILPTQPIFLFYLWPDSHLPKYLFY